MRYGCNALSLILCQTGIIIKNVRNKANPAIIWLEGVCCVCMACRKKEKTIASLVKDVMRMRMAGARVSTVKRKIIWSNTEISPGLSPFSIPMCNEGKRKSAAEAFPANKIQMERQKMRANKAFLDLLFLDSMIFSVLTNRLIFYI